MARIKLVLNERRLGLIAAAGPKMAPPPVPVPQWYDPAGTNAAIRGIARLPRPVRDSLLEREDADFVAETGQ